MKFVDLGIARDTPEGELEEKIRGGFRTYNLDSSGEKAEKLIFGLPGNPASAIMTAHLFVLPALQEMCGKEGKGLERVMVRVTEKIKCDNDRVEYHRVVVSVSEEHRRAAKLTSR